MVSISVIYVLLLNGIPYEYTTFFLLDGHLDIVFCFELLMNKVAVDILAKLFNGHSFCFSWIYIYSGIARLKCMCIVNVMRNCHHLSRVTFIFTLLLANYANCQYLCQYLVLSVFNFSHFSGF